MPKPEAISVSVDLGDGKTISLETGVLAKQADGAVVARMGETMALCTAVVAKEKREGQSFFPLTVDFREKYAAGGKFPGGFIKREGRPSDKDVLTSRLIDRAIRPLFPDGFRYETQIIISVISADGENDADVIGACGAAAALSLTNAPFDGPIAEVRVGRLDGKFVANPTVQELEESDIDLIVAGKSNAIVMVEGEMQEISEEEMMDALDFGHGHVKNLCAAVNELCEKVGAPEPFDWDIPQAPEGIVERVDAECRTALEAHIKAPYMKQTFYGGISDMKTALLDKMLGAPDEDGNRAEATPEGWTASDLKSAFNTVESTVMRQLIVNESHRIDGRGTRDVRDIWTETTYLPRAHGSAVFTRGETQTLTSVTLGGKREVQGVDQIFNTKDKSFFLHYNFPPFSVGEARFLRGPGRREIGHGMLAERSLAKVMPDMEEFPYTVRVVSDVLESNGSSSMATVCAGSMALMDAGVPIRRPVSGIAMGLIAQDGKFAILSDILGTEDHLGDMDFKVTGTSEGITACQMDIKIDGLSRDIMADALAQAREGRDHILNEMAKTISEASEELSPYAPRLVTIEIDSEFIGAIIGPGGKVIQGMQRETGAGIDIEERDGKGYVTIAAVNGESMAMAQEMITQIVAQPEVGEEYDGTVVSVQPFGAIVEILPGKTGLLHVTELAYEYVDDVADYVQVGETIRVKLLDIRDGGKLRLSRKPFLEKPEGYVERESRPPRDRGGDRGRGGGGRGGDRRGGGGRGGDRRGGGGGGGDRRGGGGGRRD